MYKLNDIAKHDYTQFEQLDGSHDLKNISDRFYIDYAARKRHGGKIAYFNFDLAREMGLISSSHGNKLNKKLENKILDQFAFLIINEYDIENKVEYKESDILKGRFMATRYLQLQHADKTGRNSGDGRSVWLGQMSNGSKTWDVSSCGTGATRLSPATSKFGKFFQNGDPSISYGCGYGELDEGLSQAFLSKVIHHNNIRTERTLCVIEFENNYALTVRAHSNLLRPSHFFGPLKQGNYQELKDLVDYYIKRQKVNHEIRGIPTNKEKYNYILKSLSKRFGEISAVFEDEYIFCWLDWGGDNILMDGSIIDYGSIRQFGLFHSEYRYDDDDRFSTSIVEQREKARYIVQTFAQMIDFVKTGKKKKISEFKKHWSLKEFDKSFEFTKNYNLLQKIGMTDVDSRYLISFHKKTVLEFRKVFSYFERAKSKKGLVKVPDGITWDAIFCMSDLLRELPKLYLMRGQAITDEEFIEILKSQYALKQDLEISAYRKKMIRSFQNYYFKFLDLLVHHNKAQFNEKLSEISIRAGRINKIEKVTGDSVVKIVEELTKKKNNLSSDDIFELIRDFASIQSFSKTVTQIKNKESKIIKKLFEIVKDHREGL